MIAAAELLRPDYYRGRSKWPRWPDFPGVVWWCAASTAKAGRTASCILRSSTSCLGRPSEAKYDGAYSEMASFISRQSALRSGGCRPSVCERVWRAFLLGNNDAPHEETSGCCTWVPPCGFADLRFRSSVRFTPATIHARVTHGSRGQIPEG